MTTNELLTLTISGGALLLSVFTFVLHQREKKQKVKVELSLGFVSADPKKIEDIVIIEAANSGSINVHLSNCCINLPNKKNVVAYFHYDKSLPLTLSPGESVQAFIESEKFIEIVKQEGYDKKIEVTAEFSNKAGGVFRSKPEILNIDKMLFAKKSL